MPNCATRFAAFAFLGVLISACGGSAVNEGSTGAGGAAGSANTASSGAGGSSGSISIGGGSAVGGAPTVSGGASAGGAPAAAACALPKQQGTCEAYEPSFWHNPSTGLCQPFVYGGCGGNENRFNTREACLATCGGGGKDWGSCTEDADCVTTTVTCCQACDPVDIQQLLSLNVAHAQDEDSLYCASSGACAPCPSVTEYDQTGKYFKPVCRSGQCTVIDVRETALTECAQDSDCYLRNGVSCCNECDGSGWVPANTAANFCDQTARACDGCTSAPPSDLSARCSASRCVFTLPTR